MIFVTHALPVNVAGEPELDRSAVWDGLVLKANNALPFVPSMTYCEVTERHSDTVFDRVQLRPGGGGVEGGSAREQEYADSMTGDYLKAVAATLNAMRRIAESQVSA